MVIAARGLSSKFVLFAGLLAAALVAAVLLAARPRGTYDASGPCLLASEYTKVTKGSSVTYRVSYSFTAQGRQYTGTDTVFQEPASLESTVYYMSRDPQDNRLTASRRNGGTDLLAGLAFIIAILAYWRMPVRYSNAPAGDVLPGTTGSGDSAGEHLRMKRGDYDVWVHVGFAFFAQLGLASLLLARLLSSIAHASARNEVVLVLATLGAVVSTLWLYSDRWRCIEAFASRFSSGVANLSVFYVPLVAFAYANYRGLTRLLGR